MSHRARVSLFIAFLLIPDVMYAQSKAAFHDAMRRLWSDHIAYTRLFIVSAAAGGKK